MNAQREVKELMNAQRAQKRNVVLQDIPETRTFTPSIPAPRTPAPRPKTPTPQPKSRPPSRAQSRAATDAEKEVEQFLGQEPQTFIEAPSRMETRSKSRLTPALLEPVAMPVPAPAPARAPSTKGFVSVPAMATEDIPPPPPTTAPPKDMKKPKAPKAEIVQNKVRLAGGTTVDADIVRGNDGVDYAVPSDGKNLRKYMTLFEAENREGFKRFTAAFGHPFKSTTDVSKNVGNAHTKVYSSLYTK
jgi:hypothetical protein